MKGILREDQYTFMIISRSVILRMRNFSDQVAEKIKIHIFMFSNLFENRALL